MVRTPWNQWRLQALGDAELMTLVALLGPMQGPSVVSTLIVVQRNAFLESSLSLHTVLTKDKERRQNESHGIISSFQNTATV